MRANNRSILFFFFFFLHLPLLAQTAIKGQVLDSLSGRGLEGASVMLKRKGKTVTFGMTDKQGCFLLKAERKEGDKLQASLIGYARQIFILEKDNGNIIRMRQKPFLLKEVMVLASPVLQHKDTITYDLTRYATDRDNTLKDVLKKLPGVEVAKNGKICYNGKELSRFTVEGMDLSKGQYNKLTDNIRAKDVKQAEVVNHDQPIKALRNRVFTDDVGMNITLKDSARDRLVPILRPYLLGGHPTHVGGDAAAMQIGKKKQLEYTIQYDRTGRNVEEQNLNFYTLYGRGHSATLPQWFSVPSLQAPIDAERLRFNTSQAYSIDHLSRTKNGSENSLSVGYIRTVTRQHTTNGSLYYLSDKPILTTEDLMMTLRKDNIVLEFNHTINADTHYGSLTFKTDAAQSDGRSVINGTSGYISQRMRNPEMNIKANVTQHYNKGKGQLDWSSLLDYHYSKDALYLSKGKQAYSNNLWHTFHNLGYNFSHRDWNYSLSGTIEAEELNVVHKDNLNLKFGLHPSLRYNGSTWKLSLASPLTLNHFTRQRETMVLPSPSIRLSLDNGSRNSWYLNLSYNENAGGWSYFAIKERQTDYRTFFQSADFVPKNRSLSSYMRYSYKRAIHHFFANASLLTSRSWSNVVNDMRVTDGNYYFSFLRHNTHSNKLQVSADVSKGFFRTHIKTSFSVFADFSQGEQFSGGNILDYKYRSLSLHSEVFYSPSFMEVNYRGTFKWNHSDVGNNSANNLFDWTQRISLTSTISNVDLTMSGVYYHNEIASSPSVSTFLMDASAVWRLKGVRIRALLRNILNKKEYTTTTYSGVGIFTNSYELRPREFLISIQFNLVSR